MGKVVKFKKIKLSEKHKGKSLCTHGFHKWVLDKNQQFDVEKGKLLTAYHCQRCGLIKNEAK